MENNVSQVESKVMVKAVEDVENKDFTLLVPNGCSYEAAKKASLTLYEYLVKLEQEALRIEQEKKVSETQVSEITPEIV